MKKINILFGILAMFFTSLTFADSEQEGVKYLQNQWEIDNYRLSGKEQDEGFIALMKVADSMVSDYPKSAELYIWRGIIESTYAGVKGGLGALKYAKLAKADLETALQINALALEGSAYTSLGTLYFNVPGWPIGFGDDEKAEQLLKKALAINPDGIDPNYFYGDYLRNEKRYSEAKRFLDKALHAQPRPGREIADEGRQQEIREVLAEVEKHL